MRSRSSLMAAALLAGAAMLLFGCAGSTGSGTTSLGPSTAPASSAPSATEAPSTDLRVSIRADGTVESAHYRLLCNGAEPLEAGAHPRGAEACALLEQHPQLLSTPDADRTCTMQYGGPGVGVVSGTLDGRAVNRRFDLRDGCGIADWQAALALLVDQPALQ